MSNMIPTFKTRQSMLPKSHLVFRMYWIYPAEFNSCLCEEGFETAFRNNINCIEYIKYGKTIEDTMQNQRCSYHSVKPHKKPVALWNLIPLKHHFMIYQNMLYLGHLRSRSLSTLTTIFKHRIGSHKICFTW